MLVAQDFLHSLCFFFGVLLQFFLAFGSGSLHRLQGLQKKQKNIREEPTKQQRALSNVLAQDFLQRLVFFGGLCFWIRKPSWATRTAKNKQAPEENTKNKPNDSQNVWAQDFLQRLRFLCLFYVFVIFGSGSFHQLLGLKKNKSTSGNNKNFKKTKTPKDFQECLGPGFSFFRAFVFFGASVFHVTPLFFGFWIRKLSTATRIAKNKKHLRKTKKPKDSKECLAPGLSSEALFFLILVAAPTTQKTNVFSFSLYRFVHVSCRRRPRI